MTPASLEELLKEWEADAKDTADDLLRMKSAVEEAYGPGAYDLDLQRNPNAFRILSLIAVVRKQREGLKLTIDEINHAIKTDIVKDVYPLPAIKGYVREALTESERILRGHS